MPQGLIYFSEPNEMETCTIPENYGLLDQPPENSASLISMDGTLSEFLRMDDIPYSYYSFQAYQHENLLDEIDAILNITNGCNQEPLKDSSNHEQKDLEQNLAFTKQDNSSLEDQDHTTYEALSPPKLTDLTSTKKSKDDIEESNLCGKQEDNSKVVLSSNNFQMATTHSPMDYARNSSYTKIDDPMDFLASSSESSFNLDKNHSIRSSKCRKEKDANLAQTMNQHDSLLLQSTMLLQDSTEHQNTMGIQDSVNLQEPMDLQDSLDLKSSSDLMNLSFGILEDQLPCINGYEPLANSVTNVNLNSEKLEHSTLNGVNLNHDNLNSDSISNPNLYNASLNSDTLISSNLNNCSILKTAGLSNATLYHTNLNSASLSGGTLFIPGEPPSFPLETFDDTLNNLCIKDDVFLENYIVEQLGFGIDEEDVLETNQAPPQIVQTENAPSPKEASLPITELFPHMKDEKNRRRRALLYEDSEKSKLYASQYQQRQKFKAQVKRPDALLNHDYTSKSLVQEKFYCPVDSCNRSYSKSSHLKSHLRRHSGEKPFICTFSGCSWKFSRSDELARHRRSHFGIKPFKCEICEKSFGRSDHLAKHRKVHGRKMAQKKTQ